jgi:hypothetical protein
LRGRDSCSHGLAAGASVANPIPRSTCGRHAAKLAAGRAFGKMLRDFVALFTQHAAEQKDAVISHVEK